MEVEAVVARATARRARGSPKYEARAKAKSKAKVEDAEALTGKIRKRTRVRKTYCHVFLGGLDPGQDPLKPIC